MSTKLTLSKQWEEVSIEFTNSDISLEQYFNAFKSILIFQGWSEKQINDFIYELSQEQNGE